MIVSLTVNNTEIHIDANPNERLVTVLRRLGFMGVKEACFSGVCGSCMILINEKPVPSCVIPIFQARNKHIITIESFSKTKEYDDIIKGFEIAGVSMCDFCNAGKIFVTHALINSDKKITLETIQDEFSGNLCRCTSYEDLLKGVKEARLIRKRRIT